MALPIQVKSEVCMVKVNRRLESKSQLGWLHCADEREKGLTPTNLATSEPSEATLLKVSGNGFSDIS